MNKHLQGIGKVDAKLAQDLQIGDVVVWNYGEQTTVKSLELTAKSVKVVFDTKIGDWTKTIRKSTKLGIAQQRINSNQRHSGASRQN